MTQTIEQLTARVAELEEENARLKAASFFGKSKDIHALAEMVLSDCGCSSLHWPLMEKVENRLYAFFDEQLVAEQLNNKRLRDALNQTNFWLEGALQCKEWNWEPDQRECADGCLGYAKEALATPASTEALDKHVAEKMMETYIPVTIDSFVAEKVKAIEAERDYHMSNAKHVYEQCSKITKQRDLAVKVMREALECGEDGDWQSARRILASVIKESDGK